MSVSTGLQRIVGGGKRQIRPTTAGSHADTGLRKDPSNLTRIMPAQESRWNAHRPSPRTALAEAADRPKTAA
ncbi:hypothetical protein D779_0087 [Imhoffiella purpurea]|uniref:Uncharacterized protein n=1 Tax=Imhoffiella purpurea TaxID=1249627 RepID=W9W3X7_9GAMM|nr:hypothetical protein D779_0087 [Imhoffiella purpurea]